MSTNISTAAVTPPPLSAWGERHGAAAQLAADIRERTGDLEDLPRENPRWLGSDDIYGESTVTIADVIHEAKHIGFAVEIPYEGLEWLGLDYDGSSAGAFEMVGTREQIEAAAAHLANAAAALQEFLKV